MSAAPSIATRPQPQARRPDSAPPPPHPSGPHGTLPRDTAHLPLLAAVVLALLASRFLTMTWLPMSDTTEPRYAEIARLMAESGDWITPWFEPGVPFWGKPPLSFWLQALSMKLFGVSDLAARLPAWLAMAGVVALTARLGWHFGGVHRALTSALVLSTMALAWISAGAVMTDPFLALGTTLSLVAFALACAGKGGAWRWLFFVGLAIGLLAKGPVAAVLCAIPVLAWALWNRRWRSPFAILPWWRGSLLTAVLTLPWYIAAELKTPGFLHYFIIGEHLGRFIAPGWEGDLYGNAHDEPRGMIWVFLLWASLPWGLLGLAALLRIAASPQRRTQTAAWLRDPAHGFVVAATLAAPLFFTLAGNILWTYVLPSLPFLALLVARALPRRSLPPAALGAAALVPIATTAWGLHLTAQPDRLKSEVALVRVFDEHRGDAEMPLHYIGSVPFSARYYSRDDAIPIRIADLPGLLSSSQDPVIYVAAPPALIEQVLEAAPTSAAASLFEGRRRTLLALPTHAAAAPIVTTGLPTLR